MVRIRVRILAVNKEQLLLLLLLMMVVAVGGPILIVANHSPSTTVAVHRALITPGIAADVDAAIGTLVVMALA